jgi:hypothetical protein
MISFSQLDLASSKLLISDNFSEMEDSESTGILHLKKILKDMAKKLPQIILSNKSKVSRLFL